MSKFGVVRSTLMVSRKCLHASVQSRQFFHFAFTLNHDLTVNGQRERERKKGRGRITSSKQRKRNKERGEEGREGKEGRREKREKEKGTLRFQKISLSQHRASASKHLPSWAFFYVASPLNLGVCKSTHIYSIVYGVWL